MKYNTKKMKAESEKQYKKDITIEIENLINKIEIKERDDKLKYFFDNGFNYYVWLNILRKQNDYDLYEYHIKRIDQNIPNLIEDFYYYPEGHNGFHRISGYSKYKGSII